ncbi:glycosyltransferase [Methylobacterium sp. E-005]|uniref:glycosyltransferase n=1 Tax=Methylobacterium sp. E-005 TaxID=2836549 RepID=UPI001FB9EF6C|nr:glycosyltransferase [Methylobacterium sp. E-005]MCJ2089605.1 glycosyltransferase [Methylobacterium sp. E-005]
MMAQISVVMATYNGAAHVRQQALSLLAQAQLPAELVVADDGSTDATLDVLRDTLAGAPFPVHLHQNALNKGYRRNFIEAASLASAPLVAFCDQDDVWRPDKLARMTRAFDDPAVKLAYHNAAVTDRESRATGRLYGSDGGRKVSESSLADPWSFSLGFTQVFRRELIAFTPLHALSCDFLFPQERLAHDQWFFFLASCFGRIAFIDEDLVAYRQHEANVFGAIDRGRARRLAVFKATLDHSRGQVAARGASLSAKEAILKAIAKDETQDGSCRATATALAGHYEEFAALYADRVGTYSHGIGSRTAFWLHLLASRRRLGTRGLAYPARHAVRDLVFGVLLASLASPTNGH